MDLSDIYLGICLGALIWLPIGALGWWFVLAMCAAAARADQETDRLVEAQRRSFSVIDHDRKFGKNR